MIQGCLSQRYSYVEFVRLVLVYKHNSQRNVTVCNVSKISSWLLRWVNWSYDASHSLVKDTLGLRPWTFEGIWNEFRWIWLLPWVDSLHPCNHHYITLISYEWLHWLNFHTCNLFLFAVCNSLTYRIMCSVPTVNEMPHLLEWQNGDESIVRVQLHWYKWAIPCKDTAKVVVKYIYFWTLIF